jgi:hypothetical protein
VQSANAAVKQKKSFYKAKYQRLRYRLGSANKAKVAIANRMARAIYHILKDPKEHFKDLGYMRVENQDSRIKRLLMQLRAEGVEVNYHTHEKIMTAKKSVEIQL